MFLENYDEITDCIVIDTETVTDQSSGIAKVWELGAVVIKGVDIVETYDWLVSPNAVFEKLDLVYPKEHITVEKIKSSPKMSEVIDEIMSVINENDIIGGHNVNYDVTVMNRELLALEKPLIGAKKFDTLRLAHKVHPGWSSYKLDRLCEEYGLNIEQRHRALDDAYATAVAFLKMREKFIREKIEPKESLGLFN